jgi:hypothetical protein
MGTKTYNNYEVRPVSYGSELVTNGTFSSSDLSAWTEFGNPTATVSGGELTLSGDGGYDDYIQQEVSVTVGKVYKIQVTARRITGSVRIQVRDASSPYTTLAAQTFSSSSNETFTANFVAPTGAVSIQLLQWSGTSGSGVFDDLTLTLFEHPDNIPRVEWDAQRNRLGLLVEESRTNLVTYSEDFSQSSWSKIRSSVAQSSIQAPDGTTSAFVVTPSAGLNTHYIADIVSGTSGSRSISFFAKKKEYSVVFVGHGIGAQEGTYFDLDAGTIASEGTDIDASTITSLPNGWYRCAVTFDSVIEPRYAILAPCESSGSTSFNADGSSGVYVWGAQFEAGSFPTSYIKTTGATATRSADVASIPVADFGFNPKSMSMLIEWQTIIPAPVSWDGYNRIVSFGESGGSELIEILGTQNSANVYGAVYAAGAQQIAYINFSTNGTAEKTAFRVGSNTWRIADDGTLLTEDTSVTMPTKIDRLGIGIVGTTLSGNEINGYIKSIKYYPRRLTDAQLQDITS